MRSREFDDKRESFGVGVTGDDGLRLGFRGQVRSSTLTCYILGVELVGA